VTRLAIALGRIAGDLRAAGRGFALVGGVAMSVRATARLTRDVGLVVAVGDDREAEALARDLFDRGYRLLAQVEQRAAGRLSMERTCR
jgi:sugar/nucleoside kinase (ribokinase family)